MLGLLIDTVTINSKSQTNTSGDVSDSFAPLYAGIAGRVFELNYNDKKLLGDREEFTDVSKKCMVDGVYTGIRDGYQLIHEAKTYNIAHVKECQDSVGVHHYELYLSIVE